MRGGRMIDRYLMDWRMIFWSDWMEWSWVIVWSWWSWMNRFWGRWMICRFRRMINWFRWMINWFRFLIRRFRWCVHWR